MAVRRPFILSLYGVPGVLIEYSAHNCWYFYFRPSDTLILAKFQPNRIKYKVTRNLGNLKNVTFLFLLFWEEHFRTKFSSIRWTDQILRKFFLINFRGSAKNTSKVLCSPWERGHVTKMAKFLLFMNLLVYAEH